MDGGLSAEGLSCIRDGRALFRRLSLAVAPGEVVQVRGDNGAGKTSLLRILCGLTQPQEGTVFWRGQDIRRCRLDYHGALLYIGHAPALKEELSPLENLTFYRALGDHVGSPTELEQALDAMGLYGFEEVAVRTLSAGQRRRAALARLWLSPAPLWVLDEPFTALDAKGIRNLEARLTAHADGGGSILLTSHQPVHLDGRVVRHLELA